MFNNLPDTIGLEFEGTAKTREDMYSKLPIANERRNLIITVTRDASVEGKLKCLTDFTRVYTGNRLLSGCLRGSETIISGYEMVTRPLSLETMRLVVKNVINTQAKVGDLFSPRSSIHVHVGFPSGLIFLKSAVALGLRVEPLLFKIAGMGRPYRGSINQSAYCRPLNLPPAVRIIDSDLCAVLDPVGALESDNIEGFWNKFGINLGEGDRYIPVRYTGFNVYSIKIRGTLEFRFFNWCDKSKYVESVVSLCQFLADLAVRISVKDALAIRNVSIFEVNDNSTYSKMLMDLIEIGSFLGVEHTISPEDVDILLEIIEKTEQPVFSRDIVMSHIAMSKIRLRDAKLFGLKLISTAKPANIIDIHNIDEIDTTLLGE